MPPEAPENSWDNSDGKFSLKRFEPCDTAKNFRLIGDTTAAENIPECLEKVQNGTGLDIVFASVKNTKIMLDFL